VGDHHRGVVLGAWVGRGHQQALLDRPLRPGCRTTGLAEPSDTKTIGLRAARVLPEPEQRRPLNLLDLLSAPPLLNRRAADF